jgi:hypothetical protein
MDYLGLSCASSQSFRDKRQYQRVQTHAFGFGTLG